MSGTWCLVYPTYPRDYIREIKETRAWSWSRGYIYCPGLKLVELGSNSPLRLHIVLRSKTHSNIMITYITLQVKWVKTLSLTLNERGKLVVFENRVLRRIFGPKREKKYKETWENCTIISLVILSSTQNIKGYLIKEEEIDGKCFTRCRNKITFNSNKPVNINIKQFMVHVSTVSQLGEIGTTTLPSFVGMWVLVSVCFYTLQYKENSSFFHSMVLHFACR